jgi:DNA-binding transcriptional ArsR family regulator
MYASGAMPFFICYVSVDPHPPRPAGAQVTRAPMLQKRETFCSAPTTAAAELGVRASERMLTQPWRGQYSHLKCKLFLTYNSTCERYGGCGRMTLRTKTSQHASGDTFTAIAHPIRRQILDMLVDGERPVRSIAEPFTASRPAISQHLRILLDAGLVAEQRDGRERRYRLRPERLRDVEAWLQQYQQFWSQKLDALGAYLDRIEHQPADGAQ